MEEKKEQQEQESNKKAQIIKTNESLRREAESFGVTEEGRDFVNNN